MLLLLTAASPETKQPASDPKMLLKSLADMTEKT
jgi:hypothetical protein